LLQLQITKKEIQESAVAAQGDQGLKQNVIYNIISPFYNRKSTKTGGWVNL